MDDKYSKGWKCDVCGQLNTGLFSYECSECSSVNEIKKKRVGIIKEFSKSFVTSLPVVGSIIPIYIGSTHSISDSIELQTKSQKELKNDLGTLRHILKRKTRDMSEIEEKMSDLSGTVTELEENLKILEKENLRLRSYNEALTKITESFSINQFLLHVQASAEAEQSQNQKQHQSIDVTVYQNIISKSKEVEAELVQHPERYEQLSNDLKDELKELLSEITTINREDGSRLKHKIMNSRIWKFVLKPENIAKISNGLIALFSLIEKIPS